MDIKWVDGFEIRVSIDGGAVLISANREGLLSATFIMINTIPLKRDQTN